MVRTTEQLENARDEVHRRKDDIGLEESEGRWHLKWILLDEDDFMKNG